MPVKVYDGTNWVTVAGDGAQGATGASGTAPLTTKGDLLGFDTAANRVAVGTNGQSLVADSTATAGIRWQDTYAAGKNKIINGDFGVWQRGTTSGAINTAAAYQADRWKFGWAGTGTGTVSQQTFTPGAAPVAGYESSFFQRFAVNTVGSSTDFDIYQPIEDVRTFAGQTVTFSFWAKADSARTITVFPFQVFGTGGSTAVGLTTSSVNVTTSWARYSATIAVPSISGKTIGTNSSLNFGVRGTFATSLALDIWGVQVEAGSVATPFTTATGTFQGELAACQRYYYSIGGDNAYEYGGVGAAFNSTEFDIFVPFKVTMRAVPTFSSTGSNTWQYVGGPTGNGAGMTSLTQYSPNTHFSHIEGACTGLTAGAGGQLRSFNDITARLKWSAEL